MARSRFESPAWHEAVAGMLAADSGTALADNMVGAISRAVEHSGTCLLAFHADAPPEVLHHSLGPEEERH